MCEDPILLAYDGSINECAALEPIKEVEHIQFAALLREWNELYNNGIRNVPYDRLMIESLNAYAAALSEELKETDTPEIVQQKLIDIGMNPNAMRESGDMDQSIELKVNELGFPLDIQNLSVDRFTSDNNIFAKAVTITMLQRKDGYVNGSKSDTSSDWLWGW